MKRLLLVGGGGHCRSIIDSVLTSNTYDELGIVDCIDTSVLGVPVVGTDDDLPKLYANGWIEAFITVGSIGNTDIRRRLYGLLKEIGFTIPVIVDLSAVVAKDALISEGSYIGKRAVVNSGTSLGCCSIVNSGAIVEHDCRIGAFSHISPGAVLCGQVTVGEDSHIGAGVTVRQMIKIGNHVLIGIGSAIVNDITDYKTAYGNPCRVVAER